MATSSCNTTWGDPATLHKYGQEQYQVGNLSVALEAFNQALQLKLPDTIGILDNRAATYQKLGQHESALRDGRKMIKTDGKDGRGYLRCGKVLQMMGKPDKALEIYNYGLRVLPSELPARKLIIQLKDKLQKRVEGPKRVDPFTVLPPELIGMILEYFSFRQMVGILRVSQKWETYLSSLPHLWAHLDLSIPQTRRSGPSKYVSISAIRHYTSRSRSCLTHVTLNNIPRVISQKVLENVGRYPHLACLNLQMESTGLHLFETLRTPINLRTLIISVATRVHSNQFFKLLHHCPRLERFEASVMSPGENSNDDWPVEMPNLRIISLNTQTSGRSSQLGVERLFDLPGIKDGKISERLPNLEELYLSNSTAIFDSRCPKLFLSSLSKFRCLSLSNMGLSGYPELPSTLEKLEVSVIAIPGEPRIFTKLPNLKTLSITKGLDLFIPLQFLTDMFRRTEMKLTNLQLSGCNMLDGGDLSQLIQTGYLESIEEFNISCLPNITDNLAPVIIKHMPNLRVLNLRRTQITGVFVKDLVDASSLSIERLLVEDCSNLSPDAIIYARRKGIEVVSVVRG